MRRSWDHDQLHAPASEQFSNAVFKRLLEKKIGEKASEIPAHL